MKETSSFPRLLVWPLLVLAAFAVFWLRTQPEFVLRASHCPLKDGIGVPCPTCGGTHAAEALARGDLPTALAANPLIALLGIGFALWALWAVAATAIQPWRHSLSLSSGEKRAARWLAALLIGLSWIWQFLR